MRSQRFSNQLLLKVPSTNTVSFGDRTISVAVPNRLWNSVPYEIRSADNLNQFKSKLKTYLFRIAYFNFLSTLSLYLFIVIIFCFLVSDFIVGYFLLSA